MHVVVTQRTDLVGFLFFSLSSRLKIILKKDMTHDNMTGSL